MARFYFVRHGDAYDENFIQLDNYSLNKWGVVQARQLAHRLKDNKFDAMYSSRVLRAIETCEIVNKYHNLEVEYRKEFNEVGTEDWPQPGAISKPGDLLDFHDRSNKIYETFRRLVVDHKDSKDKMTEVIIFTHGNWIRALLTMILGEGNPNVFSHFVIHNTSLTIIDVNEEDNYEYVITISDAAHTQILNWEDFADDPDSMTSNL